VWSFGGVVPAVGLDVAGVRVLVIVERCSAGGTCLRGSGEVDRRRWVV